VFILVGGGGKVGYHLARALLADHEVLVIEENPARVEFIAEELGSDVIMQGDACDAATMERAGMQRADLVVAVTGEDQDNLTLCQIAKAKFNVGRTVARINNPQNESLFRQLGIDSTVSATTLIMGHIEQELPWQGLIPLLTLGGFNLEIVEVKVPRDASMVGKQVRQLLLPQGALICLIIDTQGTPRLPTPDTTIHTEDILVAITSIEAEESLRNALTSSAP
jgi:trk system potassium uptake protein TrkA